MNTTETILIVEDDRAIRRLVKNTLMANGYEVLEAETATDGIRTEEKYHPDLVLLDLGLPDHDGIDVIKYIRKRRITPIIVLSARDRESDKVQALDMGADDYITKPFGIDEMLARVRTRLRTLQREPANAITQYYYDDLVVDLEKHQAFRSDEAIHLTPTEFNILLFFCKNNGKVLTYANVLDDIWGDDPSVDQQTLRVHVANIRRKIELDPAIPDIIQTEIGVGFRIAEMEKK